MCTLCSCFPRFCTVFSAHRIFLHLITLTLRVPSSALCALYPCLTAPLYACFVCVLALVLIEAKGLLCHLVCKRFILDYASSKLNLVYRFGHLFPKTRFKIILSATEVCQFISHVYIFRLKSCTGFLSRYACYVSNPYNRAARCLNWHGRPKIMNLLITCLLLLLPLTGSDLFPITAYSLCSSAMMTDNFFTHTKQDRNITNYMQQISSNEAVIPQLDQKFSACY